MIPDDPDIIASRATEPKFYRAPAPVAELKERDGVTVGQYQYAGVEYALARNHALIGDEPGVGKTAQAIMISNAMKTRRTLAVVPASLRLNWQKEVWKWSTLPNVKTYPINKARDGVSLVHDWTIISYDLLRNKDILAALLSMRWDHLVLDEAHYLKDPKGNQRTKAVCGWMDQGTYRKGLVDVAGRITMLSGTIMPNQPRECYNAVRLLNHDAIDGMSLEEFVDYYYGEGGGMIRGPYLARLPTGETVTRHGLHWSDTVRNQPRNLDELQYRLRKNVMVRRLKAQVLHELPAMRWHPFPLEMTAAISRALKHEGWREAGRMYDLDADAFDHGVPIDGAISTARKELGEAKAEPVAVYVHDLIASGVNKVVVSAWHHTVLDYLRSELNRHGVAYMDGRTSTRQKQEAVDLFQNNPEVKIILGQAMPLGLGWTLTAAQDVVLAEPDWVPGVNQQIVDRIHRKGQTFGTMAHVPVVPGTLDEKMLGSAIKKSQHIYQALDA